MPDNLDFVRGDETGLEIPAHPASFEEVGAEFLTRAFLEFSSLAPGNRVIRIKRILPCPGGSTGSKIFVDVEYLYPQEGLPQQLFIKFSRDFKDAIRDERGKHEMRGEARFFWASRLKGFPVKVPKAMFADYNEGSCTGLVVTERVRFGCDGIEPHREKCMDHDLLDPYEYYSLIIRSLAKISGYSRSEARSSYFNEKFSYSEEVATREIGIASNAVEIVDKIQSYSQFFLENRQLYPDSLSEHVFEKLRKYAPRFIEAQREIGKFLHGDPDYLALCHWNANIDNAWFWRDDDGRLQCGLMDWGHAGRMNVAYSLWGCLSAAHISIWDSHLDDLFQIYIDGMYKSGGPKLALEDLRIRFDLYVMMMGLAYFIDAPQRIKYRFPEISIATGPYDDVLRRQATARNQLHISTNFLTLVQRCDLQALLEIVSATEGPSS